VRHPFDDKVPKVLQRLKGALLGYVARLYGAAQHRGDLNIDEMWRG